MAAGCFADPSVNQSGPPLIPWAVVSGYQEHYDFRMALDFAGIPGRHTNQACAGKNLILKRRLHIPDFLIYVKAC
jgi:hypothetical protein